MVYVHRQGDDGVVGAPGPEGAYQVRDRGEVRERGEPEVSSREPCASSSPYPLLDAIQVKADSLIYARVVIVGFSTGRPLSTFDPYFLSSARFFWVSAEQFGVALPIYSPYVIPLLAEPMNLTRWEELPVPVKNQVRLSELP